MEKPERMEVPVEMELEEETKLLTMAEARAIFDKEEGVPPTRVSQVKIQPKGPPAFPIAPKMKPEQKAPVPTPVPEIMPKKVVPPAKKPVPPKPVAKPEKVAPEGVKSPSPRFLIISFRTAIFILSI